MGPCALSCTYPRPYLTEEARLPVRNLLATLLPVAQRAAIWPIHELDGYGRLFGTWLLEIEHRGAFAHIVSCG